MGVASKPVHRHRPGVWAQRWAAISPAANAAARRMPGQVVPPAFRDRPPLPQAVPMSYDRREANYIRQNHGAALTDRQDRRLQHKLRGQLAAAKRRAPLRQQAAPAASVRATVPGPQQPASAIVRMARQVQPSKITWARRKAGRRGNR